MKRLVLPLLLTAIVSFIGGILFWPFYLALRTDFNAPRKYSQRMEANSFFFGTMKALLEGSYSDEDSSISPEALETFREYESRLGGKCWADIREEESGYHWGMAIFPSGDVFEVIIFRKEDESFLLKCFDHQDWERLWRNALGRNRIKRDSEQATKGG